MSCKLDVKVAIIDKVFEDAFKGRYTFTRVSDDTIQINGRVDSAKSKAVSKQQAYQIATERLSYIGNISNGYVSGYINETSPYDPITITLNVNKK